jgi:hypothetical protein
VLGYNIEWLKVNRERYDHKAILEALYMLLNLTDILNLVTGCCGSGSVSFWASWIQRP